LEAPNHVIPQGTENIPVQPVDKGTRVGRFTRGKRRTFASQSGTVWDVIFSPDGKLLASAHDDTIKLWDSQTGKICRQLEIKRRFWTRYRPFNRTSQLIKKRVAFSPDGRLLASACRDGLVDVWETTTGALHRIIDDQGSPVLDLAFSPNGTHIATVSLDKGVRLWDVSTGVLCDWRQGYDGWALRLIFSPEGESVLCFYSDCSWETWNFGTSRTFCDRLIETDSSVNACAALSGDYRMVAFALPHDAIILWDVSTRQVRRKLSGHSNMVVAVAFSPNNKVLASASQDKTVRLWDCATGELLDTFTNHIGIVRTVAFSPDGRYLASGSDDQMIMVWDLPRDPFEKDLEENDLSSRPKALNQFMHHDQ
jgi:WD40 repeat protein